MGMQNVNEKINCIPLFPLRQLPFTYTLCKIHKISETIVFKKTTLAFRIRVAMLDILIFIPVGN